MQKDVHVFQFSRHFVYTYQPSCLVYTVSILEIVQIYNAVWSIQLFSSILWAVYSRSHDGQCIML